MCCFFDESESCLWQSIPSQDLQFWASHIRRPMFYLKPKMVTSYAAGAKHENAYLPKKLERGNTKGRWSGRGSKASLCKSWLCVNACCVHKFLCAICVCVKTSVCKSVCNYVKNVVLKTFCAQDFFAENFLCKNHLSVKIVVHIFFVRKGFCAKKILLCSRNCSGKIFACKNVGL